MIGEIFRLDETSTEDQFECADSKFRISLWLSDLRQSSLAVALTSGNVLEQNKEMSVCISPFISSNSSFSTKYRFQSNVNTRRGSSRSSLRCDLDRGNPSSFLCNTNDILKRGSIFQRTILSFSNNDLYHYKEDLLYILRIRMIDRYRY